MVEKEDGDMKDEMHAQCSCGGTLVMIVDRSDIHEQFEESHDKSVLSYVEDVSFEHRGDFREGCLAFKEKAVELLKQDQLNRLNYLIGKFTSQ